MPQKLENKDAGYEEHRGHFLVQNRQVSDEEVFFARCDDVSYLAFVRWVVAAILRL